MKFLFLKLEISSICILPAIILFNSFGKISNKLWSKLSDLWYPFESNKIISTEKNVVIVEHKLGFININAGIDQSNINQDKNTALLLPEDPTKSAIDLHQKLSSRFNKEISI